MQVCTELNNMVHSWQKYAAVLQKALQNPVQLHCRQYLHVGRRSGPGPAEHRMR